MKPPIFIVGANRSGTTLLRLILNAHSSIAIPDELIYFDSYLAGVPVEEWRAPGLDEASYAGFVASFLEAQHSVMPELDISSLRTAILRDGPNDFRRPYQLVLEAWTKHHGKERWGEKTPGNLFFADIIHDMFPEAHFIHLVRDPRAGVASMQGVSFFPDDVIFNALSRRKHMTVGRATLERHVPQAQRLTLRYEDLVRSPEATVRRICTFLDEPFEPGMLQFHRDADQYMKNQAASTYNTAATRPISDEHIDRWRDRLDVESVALVERICADHMHEFGYVPSGNRLPLGRYIELVVKYAYWVWKLWQHQDIRQFTVKSSMFARSRTRLARLLDSVS